MGQGPASQSAGSMLSLSDAREHYGIWRWRLERDSANTLVNLWAAIGQSSMNKDTQARLANVSWALASLERSYNVLLEDIHVAEEAHNTGAPAAMHVLSGPYGHSLDYLLLSSLWMSLGDVLVAYRTMADRFRLLTRPAQKNRLARSAKDVANELRTLQGATLPTLSPNSVTALAGTVLHETWDPAASTQSLDATQSAAIREETLPMRLYWKGADPKQVDFAQDDFRGELAKLVNDTIDRVATFVSSAIK